MEWGVPDLPLHVTVLWHPWAGSIKEPTRISDNLIVYI